MKKIITIIAFSHGITYTMEAPSASSKPDTTTEEGKKKTPDETDISDDYKKLRTTELETALTQSKPEECAALIKKHVEQYGIRAFWGMPLRRAVTLKNKELVRYLLEQRANTQHGNWGEKIEYPLNRPGYREEPIFDLAGGDKEILKMLVG